MNLKYIYTHVKSARLPINPTKQYKKFKVQNMFLYSCKNFIAHSFLWGLWEMFLRKKIKQNGFWSVLMYILILICLKNVQREGSLLSFVGF